jgi:hypothetical protein
MDNQKFSYSIHRVNLKDTQEKELDYTTQIRHHLAFQFGRYELTRHGAKLLDTPYEIILKRSILHVARRMAEKL